ncbi:hypothetical protein LCGC14_1439920 [marine sediment metagenome]|uniref:Uncharacterized protein n=1 Tax=marine sediment metagenome TaxID=412755 RepID=A0A0F9MMY3_9ZZZZ
MERLSSWMNLKMANPVIGGFLGLLLGMASGDARGQIESAYNRQVVLQGMDYALTLDARKRGAKELNPFMTMLPGSPAIQTAIPKAASLGALKMLSKDKNLSEEELLSLAKGIRIANALYLLLNGFNAYQTARNR